MNYGSIFYVDIQKKIIFLIYQSLMLLGELVNKLLLD